MTKTCETCGAKINIFGRIAGADLCRACAGQQRLAHRRAVAEFSEVLDQLQIGIALPVVAERISRAEDLTPLPESEVTQLKEAALERLLSESASDGYVTPAEDQWLCAVSSALGVPLSSVPFPEQFVASWIRSGHLPSDESPAILLNKGETAILKRHASSLSREVVKEYRLDAQSVSVPIGQSGARARTTHARGRTVVVGTRVNVDDSGWLSITSQRVVFSGDKGATLEFPLRRLVGVKVFGDGIVLQIANRKNPPTFRTGAASCDVLAAALVLAVEVTRGTYVAPSFPELPQYVIPELPSMLAEAGTPTVIPDVSADRSAPESPGDSAPSAASFPSSATEYVDQPTLAVASSVGGPPEAPAAEPVDEAATAVRVYAQTGEGSRTRELLVKLAQAPAPLLPIELTQLMRPADDGAPISTGSVRAAVRNLRRVEKGLRESGQIDREVLVADGARYQEDGANRYSLTPDDRHTIAALVDADERPAGSGS